MIEYASRCVITEIDPVSDWVGLLQDALLAGLM